MPENTERAVSDVLTAHLLDEDTTLCPTLAQSVQENIATERKRLTDALRAIAEKNGYRRESGLDAADCNLQQWIAVAQLRGQDLQTSLLKKELETELWLAKRRQLAKLLDDPEAQKVIGEYSFRVKKMRGSLRRMKNFKQQ